MRLARPEYCTTCGSDQIKQSDFRGILDWQEFLLNGFCQSCQDNIYPDWGFFILEEDNE